MGRRTGLWVLMITLCLVLSACGGGATGAEQLALDIRGEYLAMEGCTGTLTITADYGQRVYEYGVDLTYRRAGESVLTLTSPEAVAGVTARLENGSGSLEYDGMRVETGPLDENGMSPMDAVPTLMRYATEGFIAECTMEETDGGQVLRVICRDPEQQAGTGQECSLWFDPDSHALLRGELSQDGYTVIQCVFPTSQLTGGGTE